MVSLDDRTLISEKGNIVPNWLEWIFFQTPASCSPLKFYYDIYEKRSNTGIPEKLGYTPSKIENGFAYYTIKEKFYGLSAVEIMIPSQGYAVYAVAVSADASTLSDAIFRKTGKRLQIYTPINQAEDGVAYIFQKDKDKSFFICDVNH